MIETPSVKPLWLMLLGFTCMLLPDSYVFFFFDQIDQWRIFGLVSAITVLLGLCLMIYSYLLLEGRKEEYNPWRIGALAGSIEFIFTMFGILCFLGLVAGVFMPIMILILFSIGWILVVALIISLYRYKSSLVKEFKLRQEKLRKVREDREISEARQVRAISTLLNYRRRGRK